MNRLSFKSSWPFGYLLLLLLVSCQKAEPQIPIVLTKIPVEIGGPTDVAVNSITGYVYVINYGNHVGVLKDREQVAILEADTPRSVHTNDLAVDEDRNWVYVVNQYSDSVTVIRDIEVVAVIEAAGRQPEKVAVEPNSGWAYVVGPYRKEPPHGEQPVVEGHITVLHGPELVGTIFLEEIAARHVVADPVDGYVYVIGWQETDQSPIGEAIKGVAVVFKGLEEVARHDLLLPTKTGAAYPETGEVYISGADQQLYRFKQGELLDVIKVIEGNGSIQNLVVHPTTGDVYLMAWGDATEVIVVRRMRVIGRIPLDGMPRKMAVDPITGNVYVTDFWFNTVAVIQGTDLIATLETGLYPYGIGVNPANGRVYIANTNEGTVSILGIQPTP